MYNADVAELADALDLGSSAARHGGSNPLVRTNDDEQKGLSHESNLTYAQPLFFIA